MKPDTTKLYLSVLVTKNKISLSTKPNNKETYLKSTMKNRNINAFIV